MRPPKPSPPVLEKGCGPATLHPSFNLARIPVFAPEERRALQRVRQAMASGSAPDADTLRYTTRRFGSLEAAQRLASPPVPARDASVADGARLPFAVAGSLPRGVVPQARLEIGAVDDPLEREPIA